MAQPYKRSDAEFITGEMRVNFLNVFKAVPSAKSEEGAVSYKFEGYMQDVPKEPVNDFENASLYRAVATVAYYECEDQTKWEKHVWGRKGTFHRLEEMEGREDSLAKYQYAAGQFVLTFSNVLYPKTVGMKDIDLKDPAKRKQYDDAVAARAPRILQFCNTSDPSHIERVIQRNQDNMAAGKPLFTEAEYHRVLIPVLPHEIWGGCYVRVSGRAYWSSFFKRPLLAPEMLQLTRKGDRIRQEADPDKTFAAFAPSADLAPPPFVAPSAPPAPSAPSFVQPVAKQGWSM